MMQRVQPAGFISRAAAFVIDLLIVAIINTLLALTLGLILSFFRDTFVVRFLQGTAIQSLWDLIGKILGFFMSYVFVLLYFTIFWSLIGFTPGQFLAGVRVVRKNGELPSFWRALARILLFTISALPLFLGFFWVIIDKRRQAFHDKFVGTYVVYTDPYLNPQTLEAHKQTSA
jgi:uncharacterized RDD family membrane protein YckC